MRNPPRGFSPPFPAVSEAEDEDPPDELEDEPVDELEEDDDDPVDELDELEAEEEDELELDEDEADEDEDDEEPDEDEDADELEEPELDELPALDEELPVGVGVPGVSSPQPTRRVPAAIDAAPDNSNRN